METIKIKESEMHFKKARKLLVFGTILLILPPVGITMLIRGFKEHSMGVALQEMEDAIELRKSIKNINALDE